MSGDVSLFGDEPREPSQLVARQAPITDWQVDLLRKALDAHGLTAMAERQQAIEARAGRPVDSLRALTHDEALRVLSLLGQARAAQPRSTSSWDERGEDTWIDRL